LANQKREQKADALPSGGVNVWALLADALTIGDERPANSVTPEEFAEKAHVSYSYAVRVLRDRKDLRSVFYRRNGRRAVCYVPAEAA
jgi:hypothetical protein